MPDDRVDLLPRRAAVAHLARARNVVPPDGKHGVDALFLCGKAVLQAVVHQDLNSVFGAEVSASASKGCSPAYTEMPVADNIPIRDSVCCTCSDNKSSINRTDAS